MKKRGCDAVKIFILNDEETKNVTTSTPKTTAAAFKEFRSSYFDPENVFLLCLQNTWKRQNKFSKSRVAGSVNDIQDIYLPFRNNDVGRNINIII